MQSSYHARQQGQVCMFIEVDFIWRVFDRWWTTVHFNQCNCIQCIQFKTPKTLWVALVFGASFTFPSWKCNTLHNLNGCTWLWTDKKLFQLKKCFFLGISKLFFFFIVLKKFFSSARHLLCDVKIIIPNIILSRLVVGYSNISPKQQTMNVKHY